MADKDTSLIGYLWNKILRSFYTKTSIDKKVSDITTYVDNADKGLDDKISDLSSTVESNNTTLDNKIENVKSNYVPRSGCTDLSGNHYNSSNKGINYTNSEINMNKFKVDDNVYMNSDGVYSSLWNDYSDSFEVPEDTVIVPGLCYCTDGINYYPSNKYLDEGIIGINSDTYGFNVGKKNESKELDISVSGFVLAYVDSEYLPGTPLTTYKNGYLTRMKPDDISSNPHKIVATYWKPEYSDEWGINKIKVNGRHWVKVK